nr:MAG TPA: hypothetical protein [Caudoviricetes sp.]
MLIVSRMSYACILTCMCLHLHAHLDVYRVPRVSCLIGACILACKSYLSAI